MQGWKQANDQALQVLHTKARCFGYEVHSFEREFIQHSGQPTGEWSYPVTAT
jgi:hypothetical protein